MAITRRGISYPLAVVDGDLSLSVDADLVVEAIYSVLETRPHERVMRIPYGTPSFAFEGISHSSVITGRLEVSLVDQVADPDSFTVSGFQLEEGLFDIEVRYRLSAIAQPPIQFTLRA